MFIENDDPINKTQVNHINEFEKDNNRVENLEWCTPKYNHDYGTHNERVSESNKGKSGNKGIDNPCLGSLIDRYDINENYIDTHYNFEFVETGFIHSNISKCCKFWEMDCNKDEWFKIYKGNPLKSVGLNKEKFIFKYHKEE